MNKKNKEYQLKIFYKYKNFVIKELSSLDIYKISFDDIIDYFKNNIKKYYPQFILKSKYFFNGKELEKSNIIINLLMNQNIKIENIKQINAEIFLDQIYNIYDTDLPSYSRIIIPKKENNSLELYIYYPNKGIVDIEEYNEDIYKEYLLNNINSKTAYCDSIDNLFLSGGENHNEIIDDFWIINNKELSIKKLKLPSPKSCHTMSPINNSYIIIIGGNDKKAFLFDIDKKEFSIMQDTNNEHIQPFVFLWNNYIFCFSEQNKLIIAEKTLFPQDKNKWENISLNFIDDNELLFKNNLEASEDINSKIENILIILGKENIYEFNPVNNNIKKFKIDNLDFSICPNNKNLYKISKYFNICVPENFKTEQKLVILNKKNRRFHKMNFSSSGVCPKIKLQYEEPEIISEENNILIKVEFNDIPQSNKNLEIENVNDDNNNEVINANENNGKDKDILGEEIFKLMKCKKVLKALNQEKNDKDSINDNNEIEILINENFTFKKKDNENNDYKSQKSVGSFIVPNNIIYEQLIHRTSDLNEDVNLEFSDVNRNNEEDTKILPVKHSLSLTENEKMDEKNENLINVELVVQGDENEKGIEKNIKPKPNLLLSQNSLDEQLSNREVNINDKNNDIENEDSHQQKTLENLDTGNKNLYDSVFSLDAYGIGEDQLGD